MMTLSYADVDGMRLWSAGPVYLQFTELEARLHFNLDWEEKNTSTLEGHDSDSLARAARHDTFDVLLDRGAFAVDVINAQLPWLSCDVVEASQSVSRTMMAVPPPAKLPAWSLPLRVFSPRIWLALLGAAVAYALAWRVVAGESLAASAAAALRAFSSCGGAPQDRVRATPQRLQLAAALLASAVVVAAAYQGRLFDLIIEPQRYPEIDTIEKLRANEITVLVDKENQAEFERVIQECLELENCWDSTSNRLFNLNFKYVDNPEELLLTLDKNQYAFVTSDENWLPFSQIYPYAGSMKFIRSLVQEWTYMITRWNWPWINAVNLKLIQFRDTGLWLKWLDDFNRTQAIFWRVDTNDLRNKTEAAEGSGVRTLELEDFRPHLALLCVGLALAAAAFCAEIARSRRAQMRRGLHDLLRKTPHRSTGRECWVPE